MDALSPALPFLALSAVFIAVLAVLTRTTPPSLGTILKDCLGVLSISAGERCSLMLYDEERRQLIPRMSQGQDNPERAYNRRYWDERLGEELERTRRADSTFAVLAIDVDHLKRVNDGFRHQAGDALLQAVARPSLRAAGRQT